MESAFSFEILVLLIGTFAAAFVTGLAGFAFGMVAAGIWLHALTPVDVAVLIVAYAFLLQGHATWKLRRTIGMDRLWPFLLGSAVGIPLGVWVHNEVPADILRASVGALLIAFSLYNLARPNLPKVAGDRPAADAGVGVVNGALAGATGLGGVAPTIWCGVRGWPRDEQRAVFQPTAVATFAMTILWFGGTGTVGADTVRLFLTGLPALVLGAALGWKLYGKLDEAGFRKTVLALLLVSGFLIVASSTAGLF